MAAIHGQVQFPDPGQVFRDDIVARIDIILPSDSLDYLLAPGNEESDHHINSIFHFTNGIYSDTVEYVGFRLRGNTSRYSGKKSFKVSFNTYVEGGKWNGLEKLNLNGEHNDPTISRAKICWDILRHIEVPAPRAAHVRLYINGKYFGLYINVEHIDEEFVRSRFGNNDGNLYKCLWPSDLDYLGNNPDLYKLNNGNRRVYDLKTNTSTDDYSDLANFIDVLNNTPLEDRRCELEKIFNVNSFLKAMAVDILIGNWDGPHFNKNNFYLYFNEQTRKFEYIPYDLDNTFGIDWFQINWAERNMYAWAPEGEPRPLYWAILEIEEYRNRLTYFTHNLLETVYNVDNISSKTDALKRKIRPYVEEDPFYPVTYSFDLTDFEEGFISELPYYHTPTGILDFVSTRVISSKEQLEIVELAPIVTELYHNYPDNSEVITFSTLAEDDGEIVSVLLCYDVNGSGNNMCVEMKNTPENENHYSISVQIPDHAQNFTYSIVASDDNDMTTAFPTCENYVLNLNRSSATLAINEFMASNNTTISDENGEYDDWVELYNYGSEPIFLGGLHLSDNPQRQDKWMFPELWIQPRDFLLVWADGDVDQGPLHTSFKLSAQGEFIGIFDKKENALALIDGISFDAQPADVSTGRYPDGTGAFQKMDPTPSSQNHATTSIFNEHNSKAITFYPNPFFDHVYILANDISLIEPRLIVFSSLGEYILNTELTDHSISLKHLKAGVYSLQLYDGQRLIFQSRIIKAD